jgi:hypothetical protein
LAHAAAFFTNPLGLLGDASMPWCICHGVRVSCSEWHAAGMAQRWGLIDHGAPINYYQLS